MQGKKIFKTGAALVLGSTLLLGTVFVGTAAAEEPSWEDYLQGFTWNEETGEVFWDTQAEELEPQNDSIWLLIGSAGEQVVYIQQLLNKCGYPASIDGDYGIYTQRYVLAFQQDHGLIADGIVGASTFAALEAAAGAAASAPAPAAEPAPAQPAAPAATGTLPASGLSRGAQGEAVRALQQALKNLGYSVYVDGDYGANTASAVSAFQRDRGLIVDGYAGPQTIQALNGLAGAAASSSSSDTRDTAQAATATLDTNGYLKIGSSGEQVKLLQQKLRDLGYSVYVDGTYGQNTASAVRMFQQINGLYLDGEAGSYTLRALMGNPKPYEVSANLSPAQQAAKNLANSLGRDLYKCYKWSVGIPYVKWAVGNNVEEGALYAFQNNAGDCIGKAASFCMMARELGYECNVIWGKVPYRAGGYGDHAWCEIVYNGSTYVCDPQYEWNDGSNGYMFNYGTSGTWRYQRDGYFPG